MSKHRLRSIEEQRRLSGASDGDNERQETHSADWLMWDKVVREADAAIAHCKSTALNIVERGEAIDAEAVRADLDKLWGVRRNALMRRSQFE